LLDWHLGKEAVLKPNKHRPLLLYRFRRTSFMGFASCVTSLQVARGRLSLKRIGGRFSRLFTAWPSGDPGFRRMIAARFIWLGMKADIAA
jgi:hypothetical protein